jgi:hypothetical protein
MANKNYFLLFNSITVIIKNRISIPLIKILKDQQNIRLFFNYISLIESEIYFFFLILSMNLIFHQINKSLNIILKLRNRFSDPYAIKQKDFYLNF